ncbi:MAG: hypothetical protein K940chlam9_01452 [Chlamydiae bacterium]|nr:hypothetical protein [Chlamydiota bacterium]
MGSYTVSGGTGQFDRSNDNVITIDFDPGYQPKEGEMITLFVIPSGEESQFEKIQVESKSFECLVSEGEVVSETEGHSYQIVFEVANTCATAPKIAIGAISLIAN